jgi:oxygen-dependent protoporphyrinogen oxidase
MSHLAYRSSTMTGAPLRTDADVIVVGGGLSGLTAAFRLMLRGLAVELIDAGARPGGVIGTRRREVPGGEALYELGPNSGLDTSPLIDALLRDLGIGGERIDARPEAARRYVLRNGRPVAVPTSPAAFFATPLFSWRAKLALLREPFVPRYDHAGGAEESISSFVRRRLNQEFLDYAIEPFVGGVYAGNPDELSLAAAFPRLVALEQTYGSLIRGQILGARERRRVAAQTGERPKNLAPSFSFKGGMQTLTDALARHLPKVIAGARAGSLRRDGDAWVVGVEQSGGGNDIGSGSGDGGVQRFERRARAVLLALPAYEAAPLLAPLSAAAGEALAGIVYPPVASVTTAYRRHEIRHKLDGFGFLAPRVEQADVLGTLFTSSMFDGRAPDGVVVLTSFVGGRRNADAALAQQDHIAADVVRANDRYLGGGSPLFTSVHKWPRAIPQYLLGHQRRLDAVAALEQQQPALAVFGNWRGGVSIADCIKAGCEQAERIAALLPPAAPLPVRAATEAAVA